MRLTLALAFIPLAAHGQGLTTAALEGRVVDERTQMPLPEVNVTVVHEPSGTRYGTSTLANGRYRLTGLRVGGPYTVGIAGTGVLAETQREIFLTLGETTTVDFVSASEIVELPAFVIETERDSVFGYGRTSAGTEFSERQIAAIPTVRRDIADSMKLDPRVVLIARGEGLFASAQGQNPRLNSILIDGIQAGDPTGLSYNGYATLRSPVSLDAIEELSVDLSPYDVQHAGFTGALVNAVTKSGTNEIHGSIHYEYMNQDMRGRHPVTAEADALDERTFGFTLGGPLVRDRLFFFLGYEDFRSEAAPPVPNFVPDAAQLERVVVAARAAGDYDPGTLDATNISVQRSWLAKFDWNLGHDHRLRLTWRDNDGVRPIFQDLEGTTSTSLSNHWYSIPRINTDLAAHLFSHWSPAFRTEISLSRSDYDFSFRRSGALYPQVAVYGVSGVRRDTGAIADGSVVIGTPFPAHYTVLLSRTTTARFTGEYSLGDHTLVSGLDIDKAHKPWATILGYYGIYTFSTIANWEAGAPVYSYLLSRPIGGRTVEEVFPPSDLTMSGYYLEDIWRPNPRITITAGVRIDVPKATGAPVPQNPAFLEAFGQRYNTTLDESPVACPRLAFNWEPPTRRRTQIRGGLGLFQGRTPPLWMSETLMSSGLVGTVALGGAMVPSDFVFNPDPATQQAPAGSPVAPNIVVLAPNYRQPLTLKGNLAIDHTLPWWDFVFSAELTALRNEETSTLHFLNYATPASGPATMPDGRIRYAGRRRVPAFADVFELASVRAGHGSSFTVSLSRSLRDRWAASLSWTHGHATEINPFDAYMAKDNHPYRPAFNPNEDVAATSSTSIDHRVLFSVTREFEFFQRAPTTVTLTYDGRSGRPYSFVFRGDANFDGYSENDLLYVPTGPDDPKVSWSSAAERDAFFAYVDGSDLARYCGSGVPRNAVRAPWTNNVDLKITQVLPLGWRDASAEVFVTLTNLGDLLNDRSARYTDIQSGRMAVAATSYDPTGNGGLGRWRYTFNADTLGEVPLTVAGFITPVSRWEAQVGVRLKF